METKRVTEEFFLRGSSDWTSTTVRSTMNDIERLFEACDEALSSAGMGPTGYEKQDIEAVADGMKCLLVYVRSAHKQVYKELDNPLYKDFVNDATGALADIRLDEITTENTFRMEVHNEIRSAGYPRYDNAVNNKLTISDFMGITEVEPGEGIPVLENVDSVGWFKYMFRMDYEAQDFSRAEVREILKEYVSLGEFDHKGYHPVKGFVSGVLDVTIVKPAIEAIIGRDLITHERLTDFERGMQGVNAVIGVITLGQGAVAAKAAGEGIFKTVFKTWAIDALSDTAAYTVGSICDENGVPLGITLVLSTLTGCSVSKKAGKYLLTDEVSGIVTEYTAEEVQSLLREANVDGLAEDGIEIFERMSKSGEEIIEGAKREKEALEAAVKGIKAADVTDTVKLAKAAGNINSLTNVVKAADGTNVVEKVLKKPLTEKKTLSEGLMAKAVGNINSIINAVKTGENSADAIQQAVNGIKAIDITETIKQVEIPKKNTVNEVLSKNLDLSEILTEEERRYYEALRRGSQAGLTQAELLGIGKVDEYLAISKVDYDEVLALRKGVNGGVSGSKTILYTDYNNIYQRSIHNPNAEEIMLGKYDGGGSTSYITKAGDEYKYFSLGEDWNKIESIYGFTDNDMFKLFNEPFLDDGINDGKIFHFSHNPVDDTGALAQEYQYLLNNNYIWDEITMTMSPLY